MLHRTLSRGGLGRRAAVDFVVCFGCGGISCFFVVFFSSNTHGLLQVWGHLASLTSLLVMRQGQGSEATEAFFFCKAKNPLHNEAVFRLKAEKPLHTGVRTGFHYLISLSVRLSVCLYVCMCNIRRFY